MSIRRSLAAVLSVGTLLLATACAGDDLDSGSDNADDSTSPAATESESASTSAGGPLTIAGQNFPEATLVAAMYQQLLENAGYDVTTKLVDTRDGYMADFPGDVDIVPEYVGGIVNFLNSRKNGDNADAVRGRRRPAARRRRQGAARRGGHHPARPVRGDRHQRVLGHPGVLRRQRRHQAVRPRGQVSVKLAAAPDCEGRLDCEGGLSDQYGIDVTEVLPLGYASDQTYQSVLDGESELGETSTTDGTLESQGLVVLEDDKQIQPAQNLVPAVSTEFLSAHPDVADILNPLMAALTTENLTELNGRIAVDREKPEDVAARLPRPRTACSSPVGS